MENLVNLGHNSEIAGTGSQAEVDALNKSLSTGGPVYSNTTPGNFTQGNVFQTESLEPTLKVVSEIDKHIMLFNMLNKSKAYQLVEEFDLQTAHGGAGNAWIDESDNEPSQEDASYFRDFEIVKYLGVKKQISHVMTQIRSGHGDVVAKETKNGVSYLLREIERALWEGNGFYSNAGVFDGSLSLSETFPSWNGLDKQLRSGFNKTDRKEADFVGYGTQLSHIVDIDNATLAPENIEESCRIAQDDFGSPDRLMLSPKAHSNFSRSYYPKERFNDGKGNIVPGTIVPAMNTSLGRIELLSGKFLTPKQLASSLADNSNCLDAPASVAAAASAGTTDLAANTYYYAVRAINKRGEGVPTISAGVVVTAGQQVAVTIGAPDDPALQSSLNGDLSILGYAVYRGIAASISAMNFCGRVEANGASSVVFTDLNNYKPGTSQAYLLQCDADTMTLRQLTPMLKIDFAIIGLFRHWAQVMYAVPIVYKPNFSVILQNIQENGGTY